MRERIYENIDYLEIKLLGQQTKDILSGIVQNAPSKIIGDVFKFEIRHRSDFSDNKYTIYDVYFPDNGEFIDTEPIASINWIRATTSKNGVFITFPGFPFSTYGPTIVYTFLDSIGYNYDKYKFIPYRVDYCIDIVGLEVHQVEGLLKSKTLPFTSYPLRRDPFTNLTTWFKLPFSEDDLRVYNKKLDISDRKTHFKIPKYKEYLKNPLHITRIEIQLNRPKFKKKIVYELEDLIEYSRQALFKKINKYFDTKELPTKNITFPKDIDYENIDLQRKLKHNKAMFLAYYNKLHDSVDGHKFLKKHYARIDSNLFPL